MVTLTLAFGLLTIIGLIAAAAIFGAGILILVPIGIVLLVTGVVSIPVLIIILDYIVAGYIIVKIVKHKKER